MNRGRMHGVAWYHDLERPTEGRLVAGVCAGLSRRFDLDVTLLRLAAVLLGLASGLGLVLYLLLWILMPQGGENVYREGEYGKVLRRNLAGIGRDLQGARRTAADVWTRAGAEARWPRPLTRRWLAIGLICGGLVILLTSLGVFAWLGVGRSIGLAIIAIGAAVLVTNAPQLRR